MQVYHDINMLLKGTKNTMVQKNLASTMVLLASESQREGVYMGATAALSTPCDL